MPDRTFDPFSFYYSSLQITATYVTGQRNYKLQSLIPSDVACVNVIL